MADAALDEPRGTWSPIWGYQVYRILSGSLGGPVLSSVTASATELNYNDGSVPGTVVASKTVVVDANKDISSFRNLALTGTLTHQSRTINPILLVEVTIAYTDLSAAATKTIVTAGTGERFKLREIFCTGAGTNFNAGGDRLITIQDVAGSVLWTAMPAASLKALVAGRWGAAIVPFPATAAHMNTASTATSNIIAKYTGGATDYTSGSLTLILELEKTA